MLLITIAVASLLGGVSIWALSRWRGRSPAVRTPAGHEHERDRRPGNVPAMHDGSRLPEPGGAAASTGSLDLDKIAAVNAALTERLWRLAFAAPAHTDALPAADLEVRDQVASVLKGSTLDAKYLPRRPTLMPQLMRAVQDPAAAPDRLARIVAHDPVLAADVLKLANSSRFRTTSKPIETIPRAIVVMGVDGLRGLLAVALMQPVFRASRNNFPRFPRMLWERTERAARAADVFAMRVSPQDRFESQLAILMNALGPLAVYGATLDIYSQSPDLRPNPSLCVELACTMGTEMALRIAREWETSPRLAAVLEKSSREPLAQALCVGEMLATLSMLEWQHVISADEALELAKGVDLEGDLLESARARAA